jgi:hypothetical protein
MNNIFLCSIIAHQMLRIVGFQIVGICMNLKHSWLGMDNFEMLISIEENWLNDANFRGCAS